MGGRSELHRWHEDKTCRQDGTTAARPIASAAPVASARAAAARQAHSHGATAARRARLELAALRQAGLLHTGGHWTGRAGLRLVLATGAGEILAVVPQVAPHGQGVGQGRVHHRGREALEGDDTLIADAAERGEELLEIDGAGGASLMGG